MRPKLRLTSFKNTHTIRLNSEITATLTSKKSAAKLQTKINKAIEHSFLRQNMVIERAMPIFNEYLSYIEVSEVRFILKDIEGFFAKIIRLRQLEGNENYNHWLLQAHKYRKGTLDTLLNTLGFMAKKRSETSRIVLLEILQIENTANSIENCFSDCIRKRAPDIIKMRTA